MGWGGTDTLSSLDLSFNNIRHVPVLPSLTKLNIMYLVQNKIAKIEEGELDWCADTVTSIELGGNRLRVSGKSGESENGAVGAGWPVPYLVVITLCSHAYFKDDREPRQARAPH
jgi:protein phosphatase 1 regulatory subunit 7